MSSHQRNKIPLVDDTEQDEKTNDQPTPIEGMSPASSMKDVAFLHQSLSRSKIADSEISPKELIPLKLLDK